ncbi:hypothetical protein B0A55_13560, partial [Friedmanniomyces simplex]
KARKESEAQQKRDDRATRARKAEEALKKAQREKDREARRAQKQLETESKASQKRPRGRPPKQKKPKEPPAIESEPNDEVVSVQPKSRNGRIIRKPVHFDETSTPNLSFPFLVCEAKTGQIGIDQAESQNIHSASIAVRAVLRLYSAEKTQGLLGRILVFSVSHNNRLVNLYGHYAVASNSKDGKDGNTEGLEYFRFDIAMFSLTMYDGKDRYKAYNFIRNVYDDFALEHLRRIQDAVAQLPSPEKRTGLSFATSDLAVNEDGSKQDSELISSQDDSGFKTPGEPASVSLRQENRKIREQMDKLLLQLQEQRKESSKLLTQLEEQRKDSEQQRKESKEQLDRLLAMITGSKRIES